MSLTLFQCLPPNWLRILSVLSFSLIADQAGRWADSSFLEVVVVFFFFFFISSSFSSSSLLQRRERSIPRECERRLKVVRRREGKKRKRRGRFEAKLKLSERERDVPVVLSAKRGARNSVHFPSMCLGQSLSFGQIDSSILDS